MATLYVNPATGTIDEVAGGFIVHIPDLMDGDEVAAAQTAEDLLELARANDFQMDVL